MSRRTWVLSLLGIAVLAGLVGLGVARRSRKPSRAPATMTESKPRAVTPPKAETSPVKAEISPLTAAARKLSVPLRKARVRFITATDLPAKVPENMPKLKHALRDDIAWHLQQGGSAEEVSKRLNEAWKQAKLIAEPESNISVYGYVNEVEVVDVPRHPELLAAKVALSNPVGSDWSLYVFERDSRKRVLDVEANGYTKVSGANGALQFDISPSDNQGRWFVVTTAMSPWPTSLWTNLKVKVFEPATRDRKQQTLLTFSRSCYDYEEGRPHLKTSTDDFSIRYNGNTLNFAELPYRAHLERYRRTPGGFVRVPPVAPTVVDFLDEWIESEWSEAQAWSAPERTPHLQTVHEMFALKNDDLTAYFLRVQPCAAEKNRTDIVVLAKHDGSEVGKKTFVVSTSPEFRVDEVREGDGSLCEGPPAQTATEQ